MEKKLWSNAEIVELGVENTEEVNQCTGGPDASERTPYPENGWTCPYGYKPTIIFGICEHYDTRYPGNCRKQKPGQKPDTVIS